MKAAIRITAEIDAADNFGHRLNIGPLRFSEQYDLGARDFMEACAVLHELRGLLNSKAPPVQAKDEEGGRS